MIVVVLKDAPADVKSVTVHGVTIIAMEAYGLNES